MASSSFILEKKTGRACGHPRGRAVGGSWGLPAAGSCSKSSGGELRIAPLPYALPIGLSQKRDEAEQDGVDRARSEAGGARARRAREPTRTYGTEVIEVLIRCWAALDGPAGKRLHPALPDLVANMREHAPCWWSSETPTDRLWNHAQANCSHPSGLACAGFSNGATGALRLA